MEVLLSTIVGIEVNEPGIKGVIRLLKGGRDEVREGKGSSPSVSVNASPPEWPINSNYGKEATITRLQGSILNPRTLYSRASLLFPCPSLPLSSRPARRSPSEEKSLTLVVATARTFLGAPRTTRMLPPATHAVSLPLFHVGLLLRAHKSAYRARRRPVLTSPWLAITHNCPPKSLPAKPFVFVSSQLFYERFIRGRDEYQNGCDRSGN